MKKLIIITLAFILSLYASAQNFNVWEHSGNDGNTHQCYNIIEMSDGNFLVDDDVFEEVCGGSDIGINLFKITPEGVAIDSAFIPGSMFRINSGCPRFRDPFNDNSNIYTSFYNENGATYYKALYINDNLEIVNEIDTELDINGTIGSDFRAFINHNNDIVIHGCDSDTTERFIVLGLDGTTKFVSQSVQRMFEEIAQRPFFIINKNPLRYGFITVSRHPSYGDIAYIEEYDELFNRIARHPLYSVGQSVYLDYYAHMCGSYLDDDSFIVTIRASEYTSYPYKHYNLIIKFNHDFQVVEKFQFGDSYNDYLMPQNIAVTDDGRIYVVWSDNKQGKRELSVECLDFNLNLLDEVVCLSYLDIVNFGLVVRENGGLALSGWLYDSDYQYYDSSKIYAVIFDETLSSPEISASEKPFVCYPNPAKDLLNINFADDTECQSIAIYSIDGRLVVETHGRASLPSINVSNLTPGLYLIKVRTNDGKGFTERIVKE